MATVANPLKPKYPHIQVFGHSGPLAMTRAYPKSWEGGFRAYSNNRLIGPEEKAPLSFIHPLTHEDEQGFWKLLVDAAIEEIRAENVNTKFVKGWEVDTGEDSTGDPAVNINILVQPKTTYTKDEIRTWNDFTENLRDRLIRIRGIHKERYPYVRIGEKRKAH